MTREANMKNVNLLIWLAQLGISVAAPLGGFIWLGIWLRQRFDMGIWVVLVGIFVLLIVAFIVYFTVLGGSFSFFGSN